MKTEEIIKAKRPDDWRPEQDETVVKHLGKLGEECCELGARLFRAVIQGVDGIDPVTGRTNRDEIADEIADVEALVMHLKAKLQLNPVTISERKCKKFDFGAPWLNRKSLRPEQTEALEEIIDILNGDKKD